MTLRDTSAFWGGLGGDGGGDSPNIRSLGYSSGEGGGSEVLDLGGELEFLGVEILGVEFMGE